MVKRTLKASKEVPTKRRHIDSNDENVDTSNVDPSEAAETSTAPQPESDVNLYGSGRIKSIHLRNFMCHSNFKVNLNNNVNVFVGLNGSGKSAILTAIAIGLGSKASSTSRSSSLKDLVKRGETSATIEITLTNEGQDAYEREVFGNEIIVTRTINGNSGASLYKLKTSSGRVISSKKDALDKLIFYLNIQVENPVLILNQDAARSFLKDSDPKKLYTLFMKATQIQTISDRLNECDKTAADAKIRNDKLLRSIRQIESEINGIKEKHERLQSVARLRKSIKDYKNEIEWVQVIKIEKLLNEVKIKLTKREAEISEIDDFIKNKKKYDSHVKEKIRDLGTKYSQTKAELDRQDASIEEHRQSLEKARDEQSAAENAHSNMGKKRTEIEKRVQQYTNDIEEHEKNPTNVENLKRENNASIAALEKKRQDLSALIATAKRDLGQFMDTQHDSNDRIERCKADIRKHQEKANTISNQIRNYQASGEDALSVYGRSMSEVVKRVEQLHKQGKFSELPRGPLGRYIQVSDRRYKQAVENILDQNFLQSFFVNNDKDRVQLNNVLKQFPDLKLNIIASKFQKKVHDVSNGIVRIDESNGRILMDIIKVTDPIVMNCLIDQKAVETVVLVEDSDSANVLTENQHDVPRNLKKVYLLQPFTEFHPAPSYRNYAIQSKPSRFIQTDFKELIQSSQQQKGDLEHKIVEMNARLKTLNDEARSFAKNVQEKKKLCEEFQQKERQYSKQLEELKNVEFPEENVCDILKDELNDMERKLTFCLKKLKETEENVMKARKLSKSRQDTFNSAQTSLASSRNEMHVIQKEMEREQDKLSSMDTQIRMKSNQVTNMRKEKEEYSKQSNEYESQIEEMERKIKGQRVESERNEEQINQLIKTITRRISNIESHNENIEDVEKLLHDKKIQFDKMTSVQSSLEAVMITLEIARKQRRAYLRKLFSHMSLKLRHSFVGMMELKNFTAEIEIDRQEKTLELKIIPRDSQFANAVSSTKALSGGERSYSTVAFLISLWRCVSHPFYFMDEYDVFSDEHNRHMMTLLLFKEAANRKDRQFGFLTPQDFSNIQASNTITIHKLLDPERRG